MEFYRAILCCFVATLVCIYLYLKYVVFNYWNRKGVPHDKPIVPFGNIPISYFQGKIPHGDFIKKSYQKFKAHKFYGIYMFHEPILVINDPELIKTILVKSFAVFTNHGTYNDEKKDPLSASLPRLTDDKWKQLRTKLSPSFTTVKLKQMYPLLDEICEHLVEAMDDLLKKSDVVEIKELTTRFTVDCISSIAFGLNCNSLANPEENEFYKYAKISTYFGKIFVLLNFYVPSLIKFYRVPDLRKEITSFFINLFEKMVLHRKKEKVVRNDFLNMLVQLMNRGKVDEQDNETAKKDIDTNAKNSDDVLTMTEAMAQAVFFIGAGQETTAMVITCCLYELAYEHEIQDKLRAEIDEVFDSPGGLTYDKITKMEYLDAVFCETLRMHPTTSVLTRISSEDFDLPGANFRIPKGTRLAIPKIGMHWDSDIYPQPEKFDPSRFSPEQRAQRHPFSYLPFGEGPRICIGKNLGILKPKIALCHLLRNYEFDRTPRTSLSYVNDSFIQFPKDEVYLRVTKRKLVA